jgi:hypothetical protein
MLLQAASAIAADTAAPKLLDGLEPDSVLAAYSMARVLRSKYRGPLFRVRREAPSPGFQKAFYSCEDFSPASEDIFPEANGVISSTEMSNALTKFLCATDKAFVSRIYDQTGKGHDLIQDAEGRQPALNPNFTGLPKYPLAEAHGAQFMKTNLRVPADSLDAIIVASEQHGPDGSNARLLSFGGAHGAAEDDAHGSHQAVLFASLGSKSYYVYGCKACSGVEESYPQTGVGAASWVASMFFDGTPGGKSGTQRFWWNGMPYGWASYAGTFTYDDVLLLFARATGTGTYDSFWDGSFRELVVGTGISEEKRIKLETDMDTFWDFHQHQTPPEAAQP